MFLRPEASFDAALILNPLEAAKRSQFIFETPAG
jgi:hypothetical protein